MMKPRDWEDEGRCEWRRMKRKNITRPVKILAERSRGTTFEVVHGRGSVDNITEETYHLLIPS